MKLMNYFKRFIKKKAPLNAVKFSPSLPFLLNKLKERAIPIHLHFENRLTPFISTVLNFDKEEGFLRIEETNHPEGHLKICRQEPFEVQARVEDMLLSFKSVLLHYHSLDNAYLLAFPEQAQIYQRRKIERIILPFPSPLLADFFIPGLPRVRSQVLDISTAGIGLSIPYNLKKILQRYPTIETCRLINPFLPSQEFSLKMQHYHYDRERQMTIAGYQFLHLDNVKLKYLSTLLSRL